MRRERFLGTPFTINLVMALNCPTGFIWLKSVLDGEKEIHFDNFNFSFWMKYPSYGSSWPDLLCGDGTFL